MFQNHHNYKGRSTLCTQRTYPLNYLAIQPCGSHLLRRYRHVIGISGASLFEKCGMKSVADLGGFVRVRTNPPFFQVINLLLATFPLLRSVFSMETEHPLTSYRQQGHSCRGGSFLFISLQLKAS